MCSISPFMSTTHLCNNHMQPGAQSNEFSSRMQIKKHSGSKKDVQLLLEGLEDQLQELETQDKSLHSWR